MIRSPTLTLGKIICPSELVVPSKVQLWITWALGTGVPCSFCTCTIEVRVGVGVCVGVPVATVGVGVGGKLPPFQSTLYGAIGNVVTRPPSLARLTMTLSGLLISHSTYITREPSGDHVGSLSFPGMLGSVKGVPVPPPEFIT